MPDPIIHFLNKHPAVVARIEQGGLTPDSYSECLRLSYRDFAVVCHQRSGSHLLATALDSHPEISCQGELLHILKRPDKNYAPLPIKPARRVHGAIIMYSHMLIASRLGIVPGKLVHLLRDPHDTARSSALNAASRAANAAHSSHSVRTHPNVRSAALTGDAAQIEDKAKRIAAQHEENLRSLPQPRIDVMYEEICGGKGKDIDQIDTQTGVRICQFLGVDETSRLTTPLEKTRYVKA